MSLYPGTSACPDLSCPSGRVFLVQIDLSPATSYVRRRVLQRRDQIAVHVASLAPAEHENLLTVQPDSRKERPLGRWRILVPIYRRVGFVDLRALF